MIISSKYSNKKTVINGITFDSKKEASRYQELILLERGGVIKNIELQPRFELQQSFKIGKKTHRKIEYVADFKYQYEETGDIVVEDSKGFLNEIYKLKKKLFLFKFPEYIFLET